MKDCAIFNKALEDLFGNSQSPKLPEVDRLVTVHNPQWLAIFATMYKFEHVDNVWFQQKILIEASEIIFDYMLDPEPFIKGDRNKYYVGIHYQRRFLNPFCLGLTVFGGLVKKDAEPYFKRCREFAVGIFQLTKDREDLTFFTSANVGYGTNHLAVELFGLTSYFLQHGQLSPVAGLDREYLLSYLDKLMCYQSHSGFWIESDGPALSYNTLSAISLFKVANLLNVFNKYEEHFKRAARAHALTTFPNLYFADCADGRNSGAQMISRYSFLLCDKSSQPLYHAITNFHMSQKEVSVFKNSGELFHIFEDIMLLDQFKNTETIEQNEDYCVVIPEGFAFKRSGSWRMAFSNCRFRPRPEGHFNFDYQNLFSLYHDCFGSVFAGQNSKNDPGISTFSNQLSSFDGAPVKESVWIYTPDEGCFIKENNSFGVVRNYRGFEGKILIDVLNDNEVLICIKAVSREDEYPVSFNLILPVQCDGSFEHNCKRIELEPSGKFNLKLNNDDVLIFNPEENPNMLKTVVSRKIEMSTDHESEIIWPYVPFDPYNLKDDIQKNPKKYFCVLKVLIHKKEDIRIRLLVK